MNHVILAFEVMGKIISGMFWNPAGLSVLILFGALIAVWVLKAETSSRG
jgi:hypothetical protein